MPLQTLLVLAICAVSPADGLLAQDAKETPTPQPITTLDPTVPREQLRLMVRPLTKSELEVEANAWFELLRIKSRQIAAARLGLKKANEALAADDDQTAQATLETAATVKESADSAAAKTEQRLTDAAAERLSVNGPSEGDSPEGDGPEGDGPEGDGPDQASQADSAAEAAPAAEPPQAE